jgi:hypothetical protein
MMRLFQNYGLTSGYRAQFHENVQNRTRFSDLIHAFLNDRYGAMHLLEPILAQDESAFFTIGDDTAIQRAWAREHGFPEKTSLTDILLAQIEAHKTEVFYNLDPVRYGNEFVRRLPGCVRMTIAWRSAPSGDADFGAFDLLVCNFPTILESYRARGWRAEMFYPGHDPVLDEYAHNTSRPIDVLFVGGYSRHHVRRAAILSSVATLQSDYHVEFRLESSRLTRLAELPIGALPWLKRFRRPQEIRNISRGPAYGRDLYSLLSRSKIVVNGAVDMAGNDRGNMRCWEALGAAATMIADAGKFPPGMTDGVTMWAYRSAKDAVEKIRYALQHPEESRQMAKAGHFMLSQDYNKKQQWQRFCALVSDFSA